MQISRLSWCNPSLVYFSSPAFFFVRILQTFHLKKLVSKGFVKMPKSPRSSLLMCRKGKYPAVYAANIQSMKSYDETLKFYIKAIIDTSRLMKVLDIQ